MTITNCVGPEDINGCNLKLILGLVWTLIGHYQIRSSGRGLSTKQAMKEWLNTLIPEYDIQNFNTDWNDGRAVCGLVDRLKPGLCPNHKSLNPSNGLENCRHGMQLARDHLEVPMVLDPEDLNNPNVDDLSVMTYISYFFYPSGKSLLEWIQAKIPQQKITNFSTDWNSGVNLAALMESCHKGLVPNWKDLDPHNASENLDKCVRLAKGRLDIVCPVDPAELSDPKVDEIIVATYLSRFKYSKLLAKAEELSVTSPDFGKTGSGVVKEPIEVPLDLGESPDLVLPNLKVAAIGPSAEAVVTLGTSDSHHAKASFIPIEPGVYKLWCQMNEENINGSPVTIPVIDPAEWFMTRDPPKYLKVNKEEEITIKGLAYGSTPVVAVETTDKHGFPASHLEGNISEVDPETYKLTLLSSDVGPADVNVTVAGKNIQKSPFFVSVCDPTKCSVSGIDPDETVVLGDPVQFTIDTDGCGDEKPVVTARGPSHNEKQLPLEETDDGQYDVSFTPSEPGQHSIDVTIAGDPVPGSPFIVPVLDLDQWIITSDIPEYLQVNVLLNISLEGPAIGNPVIAFNAVMVPQGEEQSVTTDVIKEGPGVYQLMLTSSEVGKVEGHVTIIDKEAKKSPFTIQVCDTAKCTVSGLDGKEVLIGDPVEFSINTTGSGDDIPNVKPQGPTVLYVPTVEKSNDSEYQVSFVPKETGVLTIPVTFGGTDIPGSPFNISVIDPNSWNIVSDIPKVMQVNETIELDVKCHTAGNVADLSCSTDDTERLSAVLNEVTHNECVLVLKGMEPGCATVNVKLLENDIKQSPFEIDVYDLTKCSVSGLFDGKVQLGEPVSFTVDCTGAGNGKPVVTVEGPSTKYFPEGQPSDEGENYSFNFTPTEVGLMKVTITLGGMQIPGSPFEKHVEDLVDPHSCSARGPGLNKAVATLPAKFIIITPEKGLLTKSANSITVDVVSADRKTKVESTIQDLQDNTYGVMYTVPVEGEYYITIKVYGSPIPGCDFKVIALPKPDPSKCRVYGPSVHPNALLLSGRPLEIYIDTKDAGYGELQAVVQGPKNTSPKIFIAEDDRVYNLRIDSEIPGWYRVNIWWAQVHIPKSPIDLKVHQAPNASKVRAYGPGLGPSIEVHKPAEFFILTRDAGIGTLTVVVHGVKDAFDVDVHAENPIDPRTLKGVYYPREGGDYNVTIKWSGVEIPGSPFQVKVIDPRYQMDLEEQMRRQEKELKEKEKEKRKRKKHQEILKQQQQLLVMQGNAGQVRYPFGVNPAYTGTTSSGQLVGVTNPTIMGMMPGGGQIIASGGGEKTTKSLTETTTIKKQRSSSGRNRKAMESVQDTSTSVKSNEIKSASKKQMSIEGQTKRAGWVAASTSSKAAKSKQTRSRKYSEPVPIAVKEKKHKRNHTSTTIADAMARNATAMAGGSVNPSELSYTNTPSPKLKRQTSFSGGESKAANERPKVVKKSYSFDAGHIPAETPVKYTPVYVATGDIPLDTSDSTVDKKKKKKQK